MDTKTVIAIVIRAAGWFAIPFLAKYGIAEAEASNYITTIVTALVTAAFAVWSLWSSIKGRQKLLAKTPPGTLALPLAVIDNLHDVCSLSKTDKAAEVMAAVRTAGSK
jgi:hypothetical protein